MSRSISTTKDQQSIKKPLNKKEYSLFNRIWVYLDTELPKNINIVSVIQHIERFVPESIFREVDSIMIGSFEVLIQRQITALFLEGEIYLDNRVFSEEELYSNILHEAAHGLEQVSQQYLYDDGVLEQEYLEKRTNLLKRLLAENYFVPQKFFNKEIDYSKEFDQFLYQTIGYDVLAQIGATIFVSPYAITSLAEYFANGLEHYYNNYSHIVKKYCPVLYNKIDNLDENL
jgi:hypothetical protein